MQSTIKIKRGRPSLKVGKVVKRFKPSTMMMDDFKFDPITPSGAQAVMEWVRLHHESVTGRDGYSDFYKKDLTINVLGPVGDIVSEWIIKGAMIIEANFGDFNWDTENTAQEITMTVQPDYCILNF